MTEAQRVELNRLISRLEGAVQRHALAEKEHEASRVALAEHITTIRRETMEQENTQPGHGG